jgi:hypothetical protein
LPVPLSPWISTVDSLRTIFSSSFATSRTATELPTISVNGWLAGSLATPNGVRAATTSAICAAPYAIRSRSRSISGSASRGTAAACSTAASLSTVENSRTLRTSSVRPPVPASSFQLPPVKKKPASSPRTQIGAATMSNPR